MSMASRIVGTLLTVVVCAACSDATGPALCDPSGPGPSIEGARADSLPPAPTTHRTPDDEWAAIARNVPGGWGGFFLENGEPTIYLVDPGEQTAALAALYSLGVGAPYDIREATVWQGRWDFGQLYDWYRYINQVAVGWPDGLVLRDINEGQNRLVYGVLEDSLDSFTETIESVQLPCELVVIEVMGPIIAGVGMVP